MCACIFRKMRREVVEKSKQNSVSGDRHGINLMSLNTSKQVKHEKNDGAKQKPAKCIDFKMNWASIDHSYTFTPILGSRRCIFVAQMEEGCQWNVKIQVSIVWTNLRLGQPRAVHGLSCHTIRIPIPIRIRIRIHIHVRCRKQKPVAAQSLHLHRICICVGACVCGRICVCVSLWVDLARSHILMRKVKVSRKKQKPTTARFIRLNSE